MPSKMTTPEENIAIMRRFVTEVQEKGDTSPIDELIHPDFYDNNSGGQSPQGRDATRTVIKSLHSGLSEIKIEVAHCVSTGDVVATHKILHGTHTGEFFGKVATGQRIQMRIMDFVRMENGMMREHWATLGPMEIHIEA